MGKGTDKLYITHSEWASADAYSASAGSGVSKPKATAGASFKRLPFNFCAVSLQPFRDAVCTADGTIFDLTHILAWLGKHGTNPVTGTPLKRAELIALHFARNEEGEYVDPVTYKVLTDNTHLVALRPTGNVFAWDTVERLNVKAKMWRDLVSDVEFSRQDVITLQDPQDVAARDLSRFKYIQDGASTLSPEEERARAGGVNVEALGSAGKVLRAKEAVEKARRERQDPNRNPALGANGAVVRKAVQTQESHSSRSVPYNAAQHTTGKAAASFTSTGLTPHTSGERALLTDEEYMLRPRRVKTKGYARIQTSLGDVNVELQTEHAPRAVWNFVQLAKRGYYKGVAFHRNIRNFMIQGGDPTGTGKGGTSVWGRNFNDEFDGPLTHDARGVVSMANKGKNTNSSQFFITYRAAKHLDRKHTIFGKVVGGLDTLSRLEKAHTEGERPVEPIVIQEVVVFVDPFEEFQRARRERDEAERAREEVRRRGGTEDERVTWTGKRLRADGAPEGGAEGGVGRYLRAGGEGGGGDEVAGRGDGVAGRGDGVAGRGDGFAGERDEAPPASKKAKGIGGGGGFGNFDAW
ncbi:MAG: Peptidyl-prolyl cis-trans isomerase cyp8 [Thelocarpon impressellum]|nr:MAG: Peptidyl-prolyl cis-trans isomerase cyp8 [Thelocarpon impressellum]